MKKLKKEYSSTTSSKGLTDLQKQIKEVQKQTGETYSNMKNFSSSIGRKVKTALASAFSIKGIVELSKYSSDYEETLNLFEVSLGKVTDEYGNLDNVASEYYNKAIKFQNQLEEKLGVNRKQTMEYQALFNQMSKSMGIADNYAYMLSENFTKLGLDLSSLFNISEELAMSKLRAGLAGQTKPLRDLGLDITQQSLQPIADELGLDRSIKQLSQAEKMCLRYIAVLRQTKSAQGDMAKTVESQANQMRIFNNQLYMLKTNIGSFFNGLITSVLPYINGIMMVLNALIKTLAGLFGFEMKSVAGASTGISNISDEIDTASDKAKKFKAQLMGFDEINNISDNKDSDSDSGTLGAGGIDQRILDAMKEYDNLMADVDMKATKIRDSIMDWLGFTKEINPETGEITWKLRDGYTNIEKIRDILIALGIIVGLNKILKIINAIGNSPLFGLIKNLFSIIKEMKGLGVIPSLEKIFGSFTGIASAVMIIGGKLIWLKGIFDIITESVSPLIQLLEVVGGTILLVAGLIVAGVELIPALIVGAVMLVVAGIVALIKHWEEVKNAIGIFFTEMLPNFFTKTLPELWNSFWTWLGEKWKQFTDWLLGLPEKIGYALGQLAGTVILFFIKTIPEAWSNFSKWLGEKWKEFLTWLTSLPGIIYQKILELGNVLVTFFTKTIPEAWNNFWKWIQELPEKLWQMGVNLIQGLINGIKSMHETIKREIREFFDGFIKGIKDKLGIHSPSTIMRDQIGKNIMLGLKEGITNNPVINTISSTANNIFQTFKNRLSSSNFWSIGSNIISGISRGISNGISTLRSTVTSVSSKVTSWFKSSLNIHSPSRVLRDEVGKFIPLGIAEGITREASTIYSSIEDIKSGILENAQTIGIESSALIDYGKITGNINAQTEATINNDFIRIIASEIANAIENVDLNVNIEAKTEDGILLKKVQSQANEYYMQTGEAPFPTM